MSASCTQWRGDIGAYVVGALDHQAHGRVTRHLANCRGCRADYDELVQVRDCLNRLDLFTAERDAALGEHPEQPLRNPFHAGTVPASRPDQGLVPMLGS